jgi:flagellar hook-length control protein FliK
MQTGFLIFQTQCEGPSVPPESQTGGGPFACAALGSANEKGFNDEAFTKMLSEIAGGQVNGTPVPLTGDGNEVQTGRVLAGNQSALNGLFKGEEPSIMDAGLLLAESPPEPLKQTQGSEGEILTGLSLCRPEIISDQGVKSCHGAELTVPISVAEGEEYAGEENRPLPGSFVNSDQGTFEKKAADRAGGVLEKDGLLSNTEGPAVDGRALNTKPEATGQSVKDVLPGPVQPDGESPGVIKDIPVKGAATHRPAEDFSAGPPQEDISREQKSVLGPEEPERATGGPSFQAGRGGLPSGAISPEEHAPEPKTAGQVEGDKGKDSEDRAGGDIYHRQGRSRGSRAAAADSTRGFQATESPEKGSNGPAREEPAGFRAEIADAHDSALRTSHADQEKGTGQALSSESSSVHRSSEAVSHAREPETGPRQLRPDQLNNLVQKAVLNLKNGRAEARIDLKPEFMGNMSMRISTNSQQVMVKILTDVPVVKEMIEASIHTLKAELQSHGLEIDKLDVFVANDSHHNDREERGASPFQFKEKSGEGDSGVVPTMEDGGAAERPGTGVTEEGAIDFFA